MARKERAALTKGRDAVAGLSFLGRWRAAMDETENYYAIVALPG